MSEQIQKLTQRIHGLTKVEAAMQKLLLSVGNLYVAEKPKQLKALTRAMDMIKEIRTSKVSGTAKILDACANELTSLREGLFTGALDSRNKKELVLSTCSTSITEVKALLDRTRMRLARVESEDDEGNSAMAAAKEQEDIEFVINKNMSLRENLPAIGSKQFVIGRAPVVVVTNASGVQRKGNAAPFVDRTKLKNLGFKVDSIDGYAILHDQMVIGVTKVFKKAEEVLDPKTKKPRRQPKALTPYEIAEQVCKRLNVATKKTLEFVVAKPYGYDSAMWFWVMPQRDLNNFAKAFPGGGVKLNEWGFAFGQDAAWTKPREKDEE